MTTCGWTVACTELGGFSVRRQTKPGVVVTYDKNVCERHRALALALGYEEFTQSSITSAGAGMVPGEQLERLVVSVAELHMVADWVGVGDVIRVELPTVVADVLRQRRGELEAVGHVELDGQRHGVQR